MANDKKSSKNKVSKDFSSQFAEAFHEVVVPVLSDMSDDIKGLKSDVGGMKEQIAEVSERIERVDIKVTAIGDHLSDRLDNHEKRIGKLEKGALSGKPN